MARQYGKFLPPLVAFAAAVALFLPILSHPFLDWDDHLTLATNPSFNPPTWGTLADVWRGPHLALYVPVTYTVWWVVAHASGGLAAGGAVGGATLFHGSSVLAHGLTAAVVAALAWLAVAGDAKKGTDPNRAFAAILAGLLFAVHPVQVDSVAWASGLKDVLAGLLGWTAVLLATRGLLGSDMGRVERGGGNRGGRGGGRPAWWLVAAAASFALALLAKPSAVAFPLAGGIVLTLVMGIPWRRAAAVAAVGALMALPIAIVAKVVQPPNDVEVVSLGQRALLAGDSLAFYVRHVVVPWPLAVDYARPPGTQLASPLVSVMWTVPLCALLGAWAVDRMTPGARRSRFGVLGAVLAAGLLVSPVLGLVPFQFQRYSSVADHYLYSAMGAVAIAAAVIVSRLRVGSNWTFRGLLLVPVAIYAGMTSAYLPKWSGTEALFGHNIRVIETSFAGHRVLGFSAARRGDDNAAEVHFRRALELRDNDVETRFNLANLYLRRRDLEAAKLAYQHTLLLKPDLAPAVQNLAVTYELLARPELARSQYLRLLQLNPGNPAAQSGLRRTLPKSILDMFPILPTTLNPTTTRPG